MQGMEFIVCFLKTFFRIIRIHSYCREAGTGDLSIQLIHDETKTEVPVRILDNDDSTYSVEVIPPYIGTYSTNLTYGGAKCSTTPKVHVAPLIDVSKIKVDGLEPSK